jgi:hypothetical protein
MYAMEEKELKPLEELNIEIPAEMFIAIIMNILPSAKLLNLIDIKTASYELVNALQKIIKSLGLKYFSPQGALFTTLIQKIREQGYNTELLTKALEAAADKKELFIAFMLIKAGADLPYAMFYDSVRLESEYGWKKFLVLIKKLQEIGINVNFNAMPFFDKDLKQEFSNPLLYLVTLQNKKEYSETYYYTVIKELIEWAKNNGYLRNLFALDDPETFNNLIELLKQQHMRGEYILDLVRSNQEVYQKLRSELRPWFGLE